MWNWEPITLDQRNEPKTVHRLVQRPHASAKPQPATTPFFGRWATSEKSARRRKTEQARVSMEGRLLKRSER